VYLEGTSVIVLEDVVRVRRNKVSFLMSVFFVISTAHPCHLYLLLLGTSVLFSLNYVPPPTTRISRGSTLGKEYPRFFRATDPSPTVFSVIVVRMRPAQKLPTRWSLVIQVRYSVPP